MNNNQRTRKSWWQRALLLLYDSLTLSDGMETVDLIFVIAGTMPRKRYGMELFRSGRAPNLLLSVGRFEVSKMQGIGFESSSELESMRNQLPPEQRQFFIWMDASGTRITSVQLAAWSTYGEINGLKRFLADHGLRKILVISTAIHLKRVALTVRRVFAGTPIQFLYCPVPEGMDIVQKAEWWMRRKDRRYVISEVVKFAGYWLWIPWLRSGRM